MARVDEAAIRRLLDPRVLDAIAAEADVAPDPLVRTAALRRAGFGSDDAAAILTQARLRRAARAKFGPLADRMLFTAAGLEQATRLHVAEQHAARIAAAGAHRVADLGCGIGGDALAFARAGLDVTAVERDPVTAALARHNLAAFPDARVLTADAESADLGGVDAVWLDPARRTAGHDGTRRVGPGASTPSLDFAERTASRLPAGIKLSPAHDRATLPTDAEAQWVSDRGDVVELVLWSGALVRPGVRRAALVLAEGGAAELTAPGDSADEPVGPLGEYVHEPDGAVVRARLIGDLARSTGTRPVGPGIAYLTGDGRVDSPFLASFAVEAVLPFDPRRIRAALRTRGIGRLEIKKRGVDLDPPSFRARLGLRGDEEGVLIATRSADRRVALLCRRVGRGVS